MEYKDILNEFEKRFGVEKDAFVYDVRDTCPMVFHIGNQEILGSVFEDEINFYLKLV